MTALPPRLLVLDLDGTLSDSLPDLTSALNRSLARHGAVPLTLEQARGMVGDGIPPLFQRGYAARGLVLTEADLAAGAADYAANATVETALYPGALAALKQLRAEGWRLAVCTNKPEAPARVLLGHLGVLPFLAAVGGGDSFAVRKPDPGHVRLTVAAAGGDMARSVMIGDHHNDVAAGKASGLPTIFASWGYGPEEVGAEADATVRGFGEVAEVAGRLVAD
jgi:phosphoglycolate phosphatase